MHDTIGRNGTPSLWIFGTPYNLGTEASELFNLKDSPVVIVSLRSRSETKALTIFSILCNGFERIST